MSTGTRSVTWWPGPAQGMIRQVRTAASGVYTAQGLVTGRYYLRTSNGLGYVDMLYQNQLCVNCNALLGTLVSAAVGATTGNIDFALPLGGRITGRVTDAVTGGSLSKLWKKAT